MIFEKYATDSIKNICCVGAGYVGGPTMAVIAFNCPEIKVKVVDISEDRIKKWNSEDLTKLPVFEEGLDKIISKARGRNLFFSNDIDSAIEAADMIFISVNTPIKENGIGAGQTSDLRWVESCARKISEKAKGHTIVVEKSTLPVKTAQKIKSILFSNNKNLASGNTKTFSVLSNPEFLAEGSAINDLQNPDRVLIGGEDQKSINALEFIYQKWVPKERIIKTNLWSSELSKLTANAFLAQRISAINSISAFCEVSGADINEVSHAVGLDSRIGSKFLKTGPGFGGSCFKKDILNLVYLCNYYGLKEVGNFWNEVIKINDWQQDRIYRVVVEKLFGNISGKKIAILGFSFKSGTNDTRESPSIYICKKLLEEGAILSIHDPKVSIKQVKKDLACFENINNDSLVIEKNSMWIFEENIYKALLNSDAVVILTEWDIYKTLDWEKISKLMRKPAWVFDTRKIISEQNSPKKYGINFWGLGSGNN